MLVQLKESLDGFMKLALKFLLLASLLIINEVLRIDGGFLGGLGFLFGHSSRLLLEVLSNLALHLGEILGNVLVALLESLLGELGDLSLHHALLVLEEAIRTTKEAIQRYNFLEESELGIGFLLILALNSFLDS